MRLKKIRFFSYKSSSLLELNINYTVEFLFVNTAVRNDSLKNLTNDFFSNIIKKYTIKAEQLYECKYYH